MINVRNPFSLKPVRFLSRSIKRKNHFENEITIFRLTAIWTQKQFRQWAIKKVRFADVIMLVFLCNYSNWDCCKPNGNNWIRLQWKTYVLLYYYFFLISYFNACQLNNLSFLYQTNRLNVFLSLGHRKFSV